MERGGEDKIGRRRGGRGDGDKILRGRGAVERIDEVRDLGLVGIADDPGNAGERGQLFGSALGVATGDDDADGGVGGVKLTNRVAGLGIGGSRDGAGVDDDDVGDGGRGGGGGGTGREQAAGGSAVGVGIGG